MTGGRAHPYLRGMRKNHWLGALFLLAVVGVALTLPLPWIVSAIPFPDLPDVPSWVKWGWRALMLGAIALAVIGDVEKGRSPQPPGPEEDES
jgi:hypothetical protein